MQPASQTQVGGDHYKNMVIQPVEFIYRNKIGYIEGSVIKYVCRHRSKNGRHDLEKAKHFIDLLIEQEYGGVPSSFVFCEPSTDGPKTMYPDEATRRAARDQAEKDFAKWKRDTEEAVAKAQASVVRETPKFDPNAVIQPKIPARRGFAFLDANATEKVRQQIEAMDADAAQAKAALGVTPTTFGLTNEEASLFERTYGSSPKEYATRYDRHAFEHAWNAVREAIKIVDRVAGKK